MTLSTFRISAGAMAIAFVSVPAQAQNNAPGLTIYNQLFAVVRQTLPLQLRRGENHITFDGATAHLEPDSVVLRDPAGKRALRIREQNYEGDILTQISLLSRFEGQTIDFLVQMQDRREIIKGKVIRGGYVMHSRALNRYGNAYYQAQTAYAYGGGSEPIIEVDGRIRFGLPGIPLFPSLGENALLRPTLTWVLETDTDGPLNAELSYVTGGMTWEADYNVIAPETSDNIDLVGLVTIDNQSGKSFENARIKLMAGDVNKIQPAGFADGFGGGMVYGARESKMAQAVTEKSFDEYHLYTLQRPTTLKDHETKQVEFARGIGIKSERIYVYDGAWIDPNRYSGWNWETIRNNREYGTQSNPKVWVMREFKNTKENGLGIPLPKGRVRFYRRDDQDGTLEFVGENRIDHTPHGELVRIYTGDAFDLVGERKQMNFNEDNSKRFVDEMFEITVRNRKKEPATLRVVEHLYRWSNWEIIEKSQDFVKKDSRTIEFTVPLAPDEEKKITYTVRYSW